MQVTPDLINGCFELFSALLLLLNIRIILKDKTVKGVSLIPAGFFLSWSVWNIYYYSHLDQWFSFYGGIILLVVNTTWMGLALYYRRKERNG